MFYTFSFQGYIPLHLASLRGHVGVVGLLLSRSTALLKIPDSKGQTCLHVAAKNGHFDMVEALLGQGSDQTMTDKVINIRAKATTHLLFLYIYIYMSNNMKLTLCCVGGVDAIAWCCSGRALECGETSGGKWCVYKGSNNQWANSTLVSVGHRYRQKKGDQIIYH